MSWFTDIRDAIQAVASVAGNYIFPGSGAITGQLVSKGAQEHLQSPLGQLAQIGSGVVGGISGNLANYGSALGGNFGEVASRTMGGLGMGAQGLDPPLIGADPIETMYKVSASTGEQDWTKAANIPGYGLPAQLLAAVNPAWAGGTGFNLPSGMSSAMKGLGGSIGIMPWGSPGNLMSMGSGIYGMYQSEQLRKMAEMARTQADPWGASGGRDLAGGQLQGLMRDPSSITKLPGYEAGLQAVQRSMAAQGYQGSGNMMAAISKYGGDFYNKAISQLGELAGAGVNPGTASQIGITGQIGANDLASRSLATLGYGVQRTQPNQVPPWMQ